MICRSSFFLFQHLSFELIPLISGRICEVNNDLVSKFAVDFFKR